MPDYAADYEKGLLTTAEYWYLTSTKATLAADLDDHMYLPESRRGLGYRQLMAMSKADLVARYVSTFTGEPFRWTEAEITYLGIRPTNTPATRYPRRTASR
jgi:hypothetical protein